MAHVATSKSASPVDSVNRGFDFDRLERVVGALLDERERLSAENERLREQLVAREGKIADLDSRLGQQEQRRGDALKRIDDLLAQVEGFTALATQAAGADR